MDVVNHLFLRSAAIGLMAALPIGPIAILVMQRTWGVNRRAALCTGLGAASADAVFSSLAILGVGALIDWIHESIHWIRPVGGMVLVFMGLTFFFKKAPPLEEKKIIASRGFFHYLWYTFSSFLLTLGNPVTLLVFMALFAGSDLVPIDPKKLTHLEISGGVFAGSFLWWCVMVTLAGRIRHYVSPQKIHRLMQGLGLVLVTLGSTAVVLHGARVLSKMMRLF